MRSKPYWQIPAGDTRTLRFFALALKFPLSSYSHMTFSLQASFIRMKHPLVQSMLTAMSVSLCATMSSKRGNSGTMLYATLPKTPQCWKLYKCQDTGFAPRQPGHRVPDLRNNLWAIQMEHPRAGTRGADKELQGLSRVVFRFPVSSVLTDLRQWDLIPKKVGRSCGLTRKFTPNPRYISIILWG